MTDTLKAGLFAVLSVEATLTALISDRLYIDVAPEKAPLPYVVFESPTELGVHHQTGVTEHAQTEIQFTVWAESGVKRTAVQNALREFLDGKQRVTFGTEFITIIINTNNRDTKEKPADGSQNWTFGVFMDFDIWHRRG